MQLENEDSIACLVHVVGDGGYGKAGVMCGRFDGGLMQTLYFSSVEAVLLVNLV